MLLHLLRSGELSTHPQQQEAYQALGCCFPDSVDEEHLQLFIAQEEHMWVAAVSALDCALPNLRKLASCLAQPAVQAELQLWADSCPCIVAAELPAAELSLQEVAEAQASLAHSALGHSAHSSRSKASRLLQVITTDTAALIAFAGMQAARPALAGQAERIESAKHQWQRVALEAVKASAPARRAAEADGIAAQLLQEEAEQQARSAAKAKKKLRKQVCTFTALLQLSS